MDKVNAQGGAHRPSLIIQKAACRPPVIGIDASRANWGGRTGVEWYSFQVIQQLKQQIPGNYEVRLYSPTSLAGPLADLPPNWQSRILTWPPQRLWTQLRLSYEMLLRPPDLLFVPAHVLPLKLPARSVITVHDVGFLDLPDSYRATDRLWQHWSTGRAAAKATALLTISDFSRQAIIRHFPAAQDKTVVTPLACDRDRFQPVDKQALIPILDKYGLRQPYFLYVGRLVAKKNFGNLLKGFRMFHEAEASGQGVHQLALVGPRGHGYEAAWEELGGASAEQAIKELGYVPTEDLPAIYAGATALLFPSRYEGFGLPVLESWACGAPVVAGQAGSLPEIAGPDAALFVDPDVPRELAQAMTRLISDEGLAARLTDAGSRRLADFSWNKTGELTWAALQRVLPASPC